MTGKPMTDFLEELKRASSALSRANAVAVEPWRSMSGALLDAVIALEELAEDAEMTAEDVCPQCGWPTRLKGALVLCCNRECDWEAVIVKVVSGTPVYQEGCTDG